MSLLKSIREYIDALVHPSAQHDALTASRHRAFIAPRLIGSVVALASFPIYLALPNDMHRQYALPALQRGVHVLLEKPMATSEADCEAMIEAARAGNAKLMIAYRLHFEPATLRHALDVSGFDDVRIRGLFDPGDFAVSFCNWITDRLGLATPPRKAWFFLPVVMGTAPIAWLFSLVSGNASSLEFTARRRG